MITSNMDVYQCIDHILDESFQSKEPAAHKIQRLACGKHLFWVGRIPLSMLTIWVVWKLGTPLTPIVYHHVPYY